MRRKPKMKYKPVSEWIGCAISSVFTALQTNQTWQLVCLILTALSIAVTTAFTLYKWIKMAKADGKITREEIEEGVSIIKDGVDQISDIVKEKKDVNQGK